MDWTFLLTVAAVVLTGIGTFVAIVGYLSGFRKEIKEEIREEIRDFREEMREMRIEFKADSRALEERIFLLATGKTLSQAMLEEEQKRRQEG